MRNVQNAKLHCSGNQHGNTNVTGVQSKLKNWDGLQLHDNPMAS
jgi:hypothetical protein